MLKELPQGLWDNPKPDELEAYQKFLASWNAAETGQPMLTALGGYYHYGYGCDDITDAIVILCPSRQLPLDTTIHDQTDNGHDADFQDNVFDPTWVREDDEWCLDFADTDQLLIDNHADLTPSGAFTISIWSKVDDTDDRHFIVEKTNEYQLAIFYDELQFQLYDVLGGSTAFLTRKCDYTSTDFNHILVTYDGSGSHTGIDIFVNGTLQTSSGIDSGAFVAIENEGAQLELGGRPLGNSSNYVGLLDDFRMFNRELVAEEITCLASERGVCLPYWELGEGGVLGGGSATVTQNARYNEEATGGAVLAGEATTSKVTTAQTTGGAVLAGSAGVSTVLTFLGGAVVAGTATQSMTITHASEGGVEAGGAADSSFGVIPEGGAEVGGEAIEERLLNPQTSGGASLGGSATETHTMNITGSGGVVVTGATFPNGFQFRKSITIAADKIDADLYQFPVGLVLELPSSSFQVEDSQGNVFTHEVRDSASGTYWLFFRADLSSTSDNIFYIYW